MKVCLLKMELSMLNHKAASFDRAMNAANKEPSAARMECATLGSKWDELLSSLQTLETDPWKSLKAVSERTTEGFLL